MRIILSCFWFLTLLITPAAAGDAQSPEIVDDCSVRVTDDAHNGKLAENDICAGWFDATFDGDDVLLDVSVQTAEATRDDARYVQASFQAGDCRYQVTLDDTAASVRPINFGEGGSILPYEFPQKIRVSCEDGAPCGTPYDLLPVVTCTTYGLSDTLPLAEDDVTIVGDVVTFHLDLADQLAGSDVEDRVLAEGQQLTNLVVKAVTHVNGVGASVLSPPVAFVGGEPIDSSPHVDVARGEGFTVPLKQDKGS